MALISVRLHYINSIPRLEYVVTELNRKSVLRVSINCFCIEEEHNDGNENHEK